MGGVGERNPRRGGEADVRSPKERKSPVGERGKNEMDVECKGDGEGSDVTYPRNPRFVREERARVGGENERKSLTGCEGVEVALKTVSAHERVEGGEVSEEVGL